MTKISKMTGTPWHVEKIGRHEGDDRRHRSRCVYYKGKNVGTCSYYSEKCHGAAHCDYYAEKDKSVEKKCFDKSKAVSVIPFKGVREIKVSDIIVDKIFKNKTPKDSKINGLMEYYRIHGELDKPVVVRCQDNKYYLQDKYLRLVVAEKLGLATVPAEMGSKEEIKERDAIRRVGTLIWQQKSKSVGEVVSVTISKVTVKYDDGRECDYDIHVALESGNIRVL